MKEKRLFSLLLCAALILALPPPTARADGPTQLDISKGNITILASGAYGGGLPEPERALNPAGYIITGTTTTNAIIIVASTSVTFSGVNIDLSGTDNENAFIISSADVALTLTGDNFLTSGQGTGLQVLPSAALTIGGTGALTANGGEYGAGIGGGVASGSGSITINGGTVNANGGYNGAGIGGGAWQAGGSITINGGRVNAAGKQGAGIGGGYKSNGGSITINGGVVTATSNNTGAGIGGGGGMDYGGSGSDITINGGIVTATGGQNGAGIGGGNVGDGGNITIDGGTVTATGGEYGAGIGGGYHGRGASVIIGGGSIKAKGSGGAAGIGGGVDFTTPGTLKNAYDANVYLTTIQLLGGGAGGAAVSSLTTDLAAYDYNMNGVWSDSLGWLYVYLPLGTTATEAATSTGVFAGSAVTGTSPTAFYFVGGANGREIELQKGTGADGEEWVQWRYAGETAWNDLVALASLTGADGSDGADGQDGTDGRDGADGREIALRVNGGYIQWCYEGETNWHNIVALSAITGPQGEQGLPGLPGGQGAQGAQGRDGTNGVDGANGRDGRNGSDGRTGADGADGRDGKDGNGIIDITKTGVNGNVDTYTISFTDGTSATFTVTNGRDGVGVASAAFNENGELVFTLTDGTEINLGLLPGNSIPAGAPAESGGAGGAIPIALGAAALLSAQLWWLLPLLRKKQIL